MDHQQNSRGFESGNQAALENLLERREKLAQTIKGILSALDKGRADVDSIAYQAPMQPGEGEGTIYRLPDSDIHRFEFAHKQSTMPRERLPRLYKELTALDRAILDLKEASQKKKNLLN